MGLFDFLRSDDEDEGCTAHHWDDGRYKGEIHIERRVLHDTWYVSQKHRKQCQHDGCIAEDDVWKSRGYMDPDTVDNFLEALEDVDEEHTIGVVERDEPLEEE